MSELVMSATMPVIALRGLSVFPGMLTHFDVGRAKSAQALEEAMAGNQDVFLVAQRDILVDDPQEADLCPIGTVARVKQVLKMAGDTTRVLVEGLHRGRIGKLLRTAPFMEAQVESVADRHYGAKSPRVDAVLREAYQLFEQYQELVPKMLPEYLLQILASHEPGFVADFIAQNSTINFVDKQAVLEELHPVKRLTLVCRLMSRELDILAMENDLQEKVQEAMTKNQKDYFLREQIKVIRAELGEEEDADEELQSYADRIEALHLEQSIEEKLLKEVNRLSKQPFGSSEAAVIRTYLDTVLELPWNTRTKETVSVKAARKVLDHDHFGLEKVKERILEILAVKQLAPDMKGQIICLVGPPGVGKTSIGMSVARSLNRKLARISLGGVRDEADIRGHRKTYIGAMPGRIMAAMAQAGSKNPVLLLDEIDKMGNDYRGDPASAMLEVLDSEQNSAFRDHFLEVPFDLSECIFILTANTTDTIPRPLLDRMEVIELTSYTDEEKRMIAKQHLLPKQIAKHGMTKTQLRVSDDALREIISCYTRESGVRLLERQLAAVCRKAAIRFAEEPELKTIRVTGGNLEDYLGVRKYLPDPMPTADQVGLVTGLAWTAVGGETLEVEVNVVEGTGKLELTGNLGDVMKESVHAAMSYIRSRAAEFHIPADFYKTRDIHVHFPEGAIPKDGPSAGITVCTAMVSALTGAPVKRNIAMTGEISIRGRVLPIGGLKEKTMAALRHGIKTVIIPADNEKDLEEIDQTVRKALNFITVSHVDAVIAAALDFSACPVRETAESPVELLGELQVPAGGKKKNKARIRQ